MKVKISKIKYRVLQLVFVVDKRLRLRNLINRCLEHMQKNTLSIYSAIRKHLEEQIANHHYFDFVAYLKH